MAYRRKQGGMQRSATFVEDHRHHPSPSPSPGDSTASPRATRFADNGHRPDRSLAAQTLLASASAARGDVVPALASPSAPSSPRPRQVSPRGMPASPGGSRPLAARPGDPAAATSSPRGRQVSPLAARPGDPAAATSSPRGRQMSPLAARPGDPAAATLSPHAGRSNDPFTQDPVTMLYTSTTTDDPTKRSPLKRDEAKQGLWGLLAQQARVMLDESGSPREGARNLAVKTSGGTQQSQSKSPSRWSYDRVRNSESPTFERGSKLDIGGHIKNALEENLQATMAENRTTAAGRKLQIRRKTCSMDMRGSNMNLAGSGSGSEVMSPMLTDFESPQIKASRDVANVMAAKVKLLQRELKTVKADLAFSKERCAQLEEENRLLRDGNHDADADEDLIRQQLETLLGEKARLANENTVYARENRFLREIVDLNQLTMQDVVTLQEDIIKEEEEDEELADDAEQQEMDDDAEQQEVDAAAEQPIPPMFCFVQEETEHDMPATPGTAPPPSPYHQADDVPAATPHTPCRHAENVPAAAPLTPSRHSDNAPAASRTESNDATVHSSESPMQRNPQEDGGSLQMTRENCSPEKGRR